MAVMKWRPLCIVIPLAITRPEIGFLNLCIGQSSCLGLETGPTLKLHHQA